MLTRLKVNGFKNLVDVDIRFGPFTCIAGANGVGKSNLFDAISFLSALADRPLIDAALSVRDEGGRTADIRSLFHRVGDTYATEMSFEAEMIVPQTGLDDLGQEAKAGITFLKYSLTLVYRGEDPIRSLGSLEITKEVLTHITLGEADNHLLFLQKNSEWRKSAVVGKRFARFFISTEEENSPREIKLHHESLEGSKSGGRPLRLLASSLPRTVLSTTYAAENRTALMARREMRSWRVLQLEPTALREPDNVAALSTNPHLGTDGSRLPATLYRLAHAKRGDSQQEDSPEDVEAQVYGRVANRLSELIRDVRHVSVDRDERRQILMLQLTDFNKTTYPARSLSDGTLRFLALVVLEIDPDAQGVICMEEPENGIHPIRIAPMLRLLKDIATDIKEPVDVDNPLRQVVVNTHSPVVVQELLDADLLVAELRDTVQNGKHFNRVCFSCLPGTWRTKDPKTKIVSRGTLLAYLNPVLQSNEEKEVVEIHPHSGNGSKTPLFKPRRIIDRPDLQPLLPGFDGK
jgi:predicted ATPase